MARRSPRRPVGCAPQEPGDPGAKRGRLGEPVGGRLVPQPLLPVEGVLVRARRWFKLHVACSPRRICGDAHALDAVGLARLERSVGEEAVVVGTRLGDREAGCDELVQVRRRRDRTGDAGRPELGVAAGRLLERRCADDVRDREAPARSQHAGCLGEHAVLDGREVDDAVRDHDVEAAVLERQAIDARLHELNVVDAAALAQPRRRCRPARR